MAKDIVTGARARLLINGVKAGYATGVDVREGIEYQELDVLDNIQVEEHVPVAYRCGGSMAAVRVVLDDDKTKGWFPKTGKTPQEHLLNILNNGTLEALIEDSVTGKTIFKLEEMKFSDRNVSINARGIAGKNVTFVAKRARDEADLI